MRYAWSYRQPSRTAQRKRQVGGWLYHLGSIDATRAAAIGNHGSDIVVTDAYTYISTPRLYTSSEIATMRGANGKLVVAYLSIGEAEDYRPYWDPAWNTNPPSWLAAANPLWPDNYKVKYWDPAWKAIMFDYVDLIAAAGFNGLYLDIIDGFMFWEEEDPSSGVNYRAEMATFVAEIRSRFLQGLAAANDTGRLFEIIGQNGEEMVDTPGYLQALTGVAKEDLRFYDWDTGGFQLTPSGWFDASKVYLEKAAAAGKTVLVVEYMTTAQQSTWAATLSSLKSYLDSKGFILYVAQERDLLNIYAQPSFS